VTEAVKCSSKSAFPLTCKLYKKAVGDHYGSLVTAEDKTEEWFRKGSKETCLHDAMYVLFLLQNHEVSGNFSESSVRS
jgi:hypothetical protein